MSWVDVPAGSDFPVENLPFGVVKPLDQTAAPTVAVAIGDDVLDMAALAEAGLLDGLDLPPDTFAGPTLNPFLVVGPEVWSATRKRLTDLLTDPAHERAVRPALRPATAVENLLPIQVGDFVDFYSSEHHATNLGRILRPGGEPLALNWRQLPVGYHGRSGTVVVSGTPVNRPAGLVVDGEGPAQRIPTRMLDLEVEVGFVIGPGNRPGHPIRPDEADRHVFGTVLVNDWSARDIQAFEYQPLGPFLAKSFATTISPWVVPLEALRPHLVAPPRQVDPVPDRYLQAARPWGLDLHLEAELNGTTITRTGFADMYWTFAQQLAHMTGNGATVRPGDLYASGTVSGSQPGSYGSLMEITWRGRDPIELADGTVRTFLRDGDTVTIRGWCGGDDGPRIGLGAAVGTVSPAVEE